MLKLLSDAYVAADAGNVTLLSLLDLSAAFDTVDHQILVERLRRTYTVLVHEHWTGSLRICPGARSFFVRYNGERLT